MEAERSPWNYQGFHPAHPHDGEFVLLPVHGRALCFISLAPVHTNFATPCEDRTLSAFISFFFAAYTVSPFTCYRHKVSHYLICPVTLTFLYRLLQSLPRAPLGAVFLFFLTEKEAMQSANIIISTKLLFTDMRTMLCCKVLICRWLSICPPSPPTFDHHN